MVPKAHIERGYADEPSRIRFSIQAHEGSVWNALKFMVLIRLYRNAGDVFFQSTLIGFTGPWKRLWASIGFHFLGGACERRVEWRVSRSGG